MTRLHRDRLTKFTYGQLGLYGFFLYGFGPCVVLLREQEDYTRAVAGLHGTALAVGALVSALVAAPLVRTLGRPRVITHGLLLLAVGAVLFASGGGLAATLAGAFLASFGGSFAVITSAAVLTDHHGGAGAAAVTEANAVAAGIGAFAPLVVGAFVALQWGWQPTVLILLLGFAAVMAYGHRTEVPPPRPSSLDRGSSRLPARYWVSWLVLAAGIGVEFCLALWAGDALRERTGIAAWAGAASLTALVAGMTVGRVVGGRLALRGDVDVLLLRAVATAGVGFVLFWLALWPWLGLAGLFLCGLGVALFYPLGVVRGIAASGGRPDLATARSGLAAALASGVGPFALGALADVAGMHRALLIVPVLLAVAAVGVRLDKHPALRPSAT